MSVIFQEFNDFSEDGSLSGVNLSLDEVRMYVVMLQ